MIYTRIISFGILLKIRCIDIAVCVCIVLGCSPQFSRLPESNVDQAARFKAESVGTAILESYETENYKLLGDQATDEVRLGLAIAKQKEAHESIKNLYGALESLDYVETWINPQKLSSSEAHIKIHHI